MRQRHGRSIGIASALLLVQTVAVLARVGQCSTIASTRPNWAELRDEELVALLSDKEWGQYADWKIIDRIERAESRAGRRLARLVLRVWEDSAHAKVRIRAFGILTEVKDDRIKNEVLAVLIRDLREAPTTRERVWAARCLGELGNPKALPALEEAIRADKGVPVYGRQVASSAIHALGYVGPAATPLLLRILKDPVASYDCGEDVVIALALTGDPAVIPELSEILAGDDESLRRRAATALARIGGKAALTILAEYEEDDNPGVRERVHAALGTLPESPAPKPPRPTTVEKTGAHPAQQKGAVQATRTPAAQPVPAEPCPSSGAVTGQEAERPQTVQTEPSLTWPYLIVGYVGAGAAAAVGVWLLLRRRAA